MAKLTQEEIENLYKPITIKEMTTAKKSPLFSQKKHQTQMILFMFYETLKNR